MAFEIINCRDSLMALHADSSRDKQHEIPLRRRWCNAAARELQELGDCTCLPGGDGSVTSATLSELQHRWNRDKIPIFHKNQLWPAATAFPCDGGFLGKA